MQFLFVVVATEEKSIRMARQEMERVHGITRQGHQARTGGEIRMEIRVARK